jgi:chromate transporter
VRQPTFPEALRFWLKLGFISFGGPAGQIAIMHREVVEQRAWVADRDFAKALNFCMVLPGPEALQLAIYLGWRLHGTRGAVAAGLCFILPSVGILLALSFLYAYFGEVPRVAAALVGLKATVVALIVHAMQRLARRALSRPLDWALAVGAFLALTAWAIPFPVVLFAAAAVGAAARGGARTVEAGPTAAGRPWRVLAAGVVLWTVPLAAVFSMGDSLPVAGDVYRFFTQAALVTFGGAYAVLAYVQQQAVEVHGWLSAAQAATGLGLAESTPGPLVIVLQFVGFMAGWSAPGEWTQPSAATITALLAAYATFLPSFVFILAGAPYVERLDGAPRLAAALAGVTAAVVGVIASLGWSFGRAVLWPEPAAVPAWPAVLIAAAAWWLLWRTRAGLPWILAAGLVAGALLAGG